MCDLVMFSTEEDLRGNSAVLVEWGVHLNLAQTRFNTLADREG